MNYKTSANAMLRGCLPKVDRLVVNLGCYLLPRGKVFIIIVVQFHASLHLNFQPGAGVELPEHCEETVFFLAFPANIFRPRIFENKSKLLSANIIWTSESSDFFFPSLSQSEPNYELRKQNRGILFQKLFPVLQTVSAGLQISGTSCLYFEH